MIENDIEIDLLMVENDQFMIKKHHFMTVNKERQLVLDMTFPLILIQFANLNT